MGLGPWGVIILMQFTMLVMGLIMDEFIIVLICAPLYTPIAVSLGFDPVWFGHPDDPEHGDSHSDPALWVLPCFISRVWPRQM